MDLIKTNAHLTTTILFLLFASITSFASNQENPLVIAIRLFDAGSYTEAEQVLKSLLDEKPDHLMVNYYYGACRTENKHYGTNEIIYLLNGSTGESPLKTDYYLGIQYHAQNRWDDALKHYTRYKTKTNTAQQQEVQLSAKIQQCYQKTNPFVSEEKTIAIDVLPAPIPREKEIEKYTPILIPDSSIAEITLDSIEIEETDSIVADTIHIQEQEAVIIPQEIVIKTEPINFIIDGDLTYLDSTNFQTESGLVNYIEGKSKQKKLNIQLKEMNELRTIYGSTNSYSEKQEVGKKILSAETNNYKLQSETNKLLIRAKQAEIEYWQNASVSEKKAFINKLSKQQQSNEETNVIELAIDTTSYLNTNAILATSESTTTVNEGNEDELIYKIQLGAYSRGLPNYIKSLFKKLSYLRKIENYTDERGIVVYTTGHLNTYADALKMQNQVRQEGVEDAFVVPYFNGKRITLKEAKEIEAGK